MKIYIDTNIFRSEGFLKKSESYLLTVLKAARFLGIPVFIPEVVYDEVLGNFDNVLADKHKSYAKISKEISDLIDIVLPEVDMQDESSKFENFFSNAIEEYGITILPYPKVNAKELVTEAYKYQKPFKSTGEGHKDYLIWKSILSDVNSKANEQDLFILTNNYLDFGEVHAKEPSSKDKDVKEKKEKDKDFYPLHGHLASQITSASKPPVVYKYSQAFFVDKLRPLLEAVELKDIPNISWDTIQKAAASYIETELHQYEAYGFKGLKMSGEVTIESTDDVELELELCTETDTNEILLQLSGSVWAEFSGFVEKSLAFEDQERPSLSIVDWNWNDHVALAYANQTIPLQVSFIYFKDTETIAPHSLKLTSEIKDDWS